VPIVHQIARADGSNRVDIFRRDDGTFGFAEYGLIPEEFGGGWRMPDDSGMVADSLEKALSEVRGRVPWVMDQTSRDIGVIARFERYS
jgi:hypothetical protein